MSKLQQSLMALAMIVALVASFSLISLAQGYAWHGGFLSSSAASADYYPDTQATPVSEP